jgi:ATP-dependent RNA helicase DDX24/MAK5
MAKGNKKGNNKNQSTKKPQANTKKPQANTKKPQVNNKKRKVEQVEYEELGGIENWDWSEVTAPTNTFMSDDIGGFLCLEEISDVEVEYEGDENTGRVVKFKVTRKEQEQERGKKVTLFFF